MSGIRIPPSYNEPLPARNGVKAVGELRLVGKVESIQLSEVKKIIVFYDNRAYFKYAMI